MGTSSKRTHGTNMETRTFAMWLIGSLAFAACDQGDTKEKTSPTVSQTAGKGDTEAAQDKPSAPKVTKLEKLELSFEAKGEVSTTDMSGTVGTPAVMVSVMDLSNEAATSVSLTIALAKDTDPKTLEQGKGATLAEENKKAEKSSDGWLVTAENTGSAGRNYELNMRREIGGKGYMCTTMQSSEAQRQAAIAICKSLKK